MEKTSDDLFEIAFSSASEGLVVVGIEGRIILVNNRLAEMFGYNKNELVEQPIEVLIPMSKRPGHVAHRKGYTEDPKSRPMGTSGMLLEGEKKDGQIFPVEVSLNHFETSDGRFIMGLVTDISKRVEMEMQLKLAQDNLERLNAELESLVIKRTKELEESQNVYRSIANNFPDGIINVLDEKLNYIFADGKDLLKHGLDKNKLIGTSYLDRFDDGAKNHISNALNQLSGGEDAVVNVVNNEEHYEVHFVDISLQNSKMKRVLVVEINVTKQKLIEIEQSKALQKEKELGEMKSRFVSMASHEFRTPLSAILSSASLIEKYENTDQQINRIKHTERIKSSVSNLTDILNDFLSFEKLNANKVEVLCEELNLCEMIAYAIEELESIRKDNQSLVYVGSKDNCQVVSDHKILKNILLNLLSNGLKYTGENGIVEIDLQQNETSVVLIVKDNGIGIPEKDQEHLFERFHRAENVANIQGTGLGLNIVKKYVELLGGNVTFESKLNIGTTFYIELPLNNDNK